MSVTRSTDAAEVARRITLEATNAGHPEMAIGEGSIQAAMNSGNEFFFIDNGGNVTLNRVVLWFHVEHAPLHVYVQGVWGPSGIQGRMLATIANRIIAAGFGDTPVTYPRTGLPIANLADSTATTAAEKDSRQATTTANKAIARLTAAGFTTL